MSKQLVQKLVLAGVGVSLVAALVWFLTRDRRPVAGDPSATETATKSSVTSRHTADGSTPGQCGMTLTVQAEGGPLPGAEVCAQDAIYGAPLACVESDIKGAVELEVDCAERRTVRISATHKKYVLRNPPTITVDPSTWKKLTLEMHHAATRVAGRTLDVGGGVVSSALVDLTCKAHGIESHYTTTSDDVGEFELPYPSGCKPWRIRASAEGYASRAAGLGAQTRRLDLMLYPATSISGRVLESGQPVGLAAVLVKPVNSLGDAISIAMTSADGHYELRDIPPGDWVVHAATSTGTGHSPIVHVLAGRSLTDQDINLYSAATVEVRVTGCDMGTVSLRPKRKHSGSVVTEISDVGIARFEGVFPGVPYTVSAECEDDRRVKSEVFSPAAGEVTELELIIDDQAGATIAGTVTLDGWMQSEAWVVMTGPTRGKQGLENGGDFSFVGVPDGEYTFVAQYQTLRSAEVAVSVINQQPEPNDIELVIPPSTNAEVRVVNQDGKPIPYLPAEITAGGAVVCSGMTDPGDGVFRCVMDSESDVSSLRIALSEGEWRHEQAVQVGQSEIRLQTGSITGRVLSQTGDPIDFAEVRVSPASPQQARPGLQVSYSGQDGSFQIDSLVGGSYKVTARSSLLEATSEPVNVGGEVVVTLPEGKVIELAAPAGVEDGAAVWVSVTQEGNFFPLLSSDATVSEGKIALPPIGEGTFKVSVEHSAGTCEATFATEGAQVVELAC